eukprot:767311-Hanusia_phi.AAC.4
MSQEKEISEQNEALRKENSELHEQIKRLSLKLSQGTSGHVYPLELVAGLRTLECPMSVMTDSYKAGHFLMYPECKRTHKAGGTPYPFPRDLFLKFIKENDGYFPVTIEALPEVQEVDATARVDVLLVGNSRLHSHAVLRHHCGGGIQQTMHLSRDHSDDAESSQIWYPTCVATLSRYTRDLIEQAFKKSVDDELVLDRSPASISSLTRNVDVAVGQPSSRLRLQRLHFSRTSESLLFATRSSKLMRAIRLSLVAQHICSTSRGPTRCLRAITFSFTSTTASLWEQASRQQSTGADLACV